MNNAKLGVNTMGFIKKVKSKWILVLGLLLVLGIVAVSRMAGGVKAEVVSVTKGELKQVIEETAEVLPHYRQTVYIEGSGKIIELKVDVGDYVKKGDLLLTLDKTDLEFQLRDAEAKLKAAQAQLNSTELINYANKIELAEAALTQAQIAYDSAQRNYEKTQLLFEAQVLSRGEFDKALDAKKIAEASLDSAQLQLKELKQGTPDYVRRGYESQLEQVLIQKDIILKNIKKQELRATSDGVVLEKLAEKNSLVGPSTPAFVIGSVNKLELEAGILADEAHGVKLGNPVEITGKALNEALLQGKVLKIAPQARTVVSSLGINQKRVPVTIALLAGTELLKPGYNVDIKILTAAKDNVLKVPASAVFDYQGKSQVFVLEKGKARLREVAKGIESNDFVEITQGLKEGETILTKPDNSIKEGIKIKPFRTD